MVPESRTETMVWPISVRNDNAFLTSNEQKKHEFLLKRVNDLPDLGNDMWQGLNNHLPQRCVGHSETQLLSIIEEVLRQSKQ